MIMEAASAMIHPSVSCRLRFAKCNEWEAGMTFVWKAFLDSEGRKCPEEGKQKFWTFIQSDKLRKSFLEGKCVVIVAENEGSIIGLACITHYNRLSLLFIEESYRGKGIGSALMTVVIRILREKGEQYIALQSVSGAVRFYRKFGFRRIRPAEEFSGIRVTCMEKFLE